MYSYGRCSFSGEDFLGGSWLGTGVRGKGIGL